MSATRAARLHPASLATGLIGMVVGTVYPRAAMNAAGGADHGLAMLLFWAMSAGLVHGVGFIPRYWGWRVLFSGWACALALTLFVVLRVLR